MMGCTSPTLLGTALPCAAEEVSRATSPADGGVVEIKVPTFRPTPTVHSVLGLLPGEYNNPVGTSIQLLPPEPAVTKVADSVLPAPQAAARAPVAAAVAQPTPPPILVTREIAKLGEPQRSWQARVPAFQPPTQTANLQPATPADEAISLSPAISNATTDTPEKPVVEQQLAGQEAVLTASRRGFPAWIEPAETTAVDEVTTSVEVIDDQPDRSQDAWRPRGEASQPQPLRDPLPELAPPQKSPVKSEVVPPRETTVGSGLPKLSPVQEMPPLENIPAWTVKTEQLPALDELPDQPDTEILEIPLESKTNAHEGNNEGDAAGPAEVDGWDGTTLHETKDAGDAPSDPSSVDVEPLVIEPIEIEPLDPLQPAQDTADLRDVQDGTSKTIESLYGSKDAAAKPSMGEHTLRDATGRAKSHAGMGAVAQLDPAIARLQQPILQTLRSFHARTEQADARSNWGMMHAIMIYGTDTRIIARRRNYSAIAWMAGNNVCRGNRLMTTERGQIKVREGTGLQGHQAQWLATLSLASVPANYPLYAENKRFTIEDLVQVEAAACEDGKELTFTLIGLAHYLDTNATWEGVGGETWDFERLIAAELDQPIVGAACGGTHRLMSFAHALRKRRLEGKPVDGQWKRAEKFLDDFVEYTYTLQNRDGSFSTDWFESPQDNGDLSRKVQTTGHILEFLLTHLPDEEIVNDRVVSAVRYLTAAMRRVDLDDAGVGYRAHALRSLAMFHQRVYGTAPVYPPGQMAFGQHRNQHHR